MVVLGPIVHVYAARTAILHSLEPTVKGVSREILKQFHHEFGLTHPDAETSPGGEYDQSLEKCGLVLG